MSIQEQLKVLQWRIKSDFPIEDLDSSEFDAGSFLMKCLSGKHGNIFAEAQQLKTDLGGYVQNVQATLQKRIQNDFEELLKLPGKLCSFEGRINSVHIEFHEFFNKLSLFLSKVKESSTEVKEIIKSQELEAQKQREHNRNILFAKNLAELQQNLPLLKQISNECLSKSMKLTHGALVTRLSQVLVANTRILGAEYHSHMSQIKSDFLLILSRELLGWSTQSPAFGHFRVLLKAYKVLGLEKEAQFILRERVLLPNFKETLILCQADPGNPDSIVLSQYFEALQHDVVSGNFTNFLTNECGVLVHSYWAAAIKVISPISRVFSPGFYSDYVSNFNVATKFVRFIEENCAEFYESQEYHEFIDKWNLPTYFELRKSDIVKPLFIILQVETIEEFLKLHSERTYLDCLTQCSVELKNIQQLVPRVTRLSLQILSTYINFIIRKLNYQSKRVGVSVDALLKLIGSIQFLQSQLPFEEPLLSGMNSMLGEVLEPCLRCLGESVTRQCVHNLEAFKTIPASYRMTNRPFPTASSAFVSSFLLPLKQISLDKGNSNRVIEKILVKFLELLTETISSVKKSESLLSKYTSSSEDQQKMVGQIQMDVEGFINELNLFGYGSDNNEIVKQIQIEANGLS